MAEIQATFAEDWRQSSQIGLLLNAGDDRGYHFVLRADADKAGNLGDATTSNYAILEVQKSGQVLQQKKVLTRTLPSGQLSLRARRDRTQLSFQLGSQPSIEIQDVFATSAASNGKFGLIWPDRTRLVMVRTRIRKLPTQPRPIETADALLDDHKIVEALELYQRLVHQSKSVELQTESQYKAAVCLIELKRAPEAISLLDKVQAGGKEPWGLLASCQRWLLHLRRGELDAADKLSDQLAAIYSFEQLAAAVPSEQRNEILAAFFKRKLTANSAAELVQIERAMKLDRLLSIDGRGDLQRQAACVKAIEKAGRIELAHKFFERLVDDFPEKVYPYYRLSMLTRSSGNLQASLSYSDQGLQLVANGGDEIEITNLRLERIRTLTAMGRTDEALSDLDSLNKDTRSGPLSRGESGKNHIYFWATLSHMALIRGFIEDERGSGDDAVSSWRKGYSETREAIGNVDAASDWLIINTLILGSLSNELKRSDVPGLVVALSGTSMPQQLVRMGMSQLGDNLVHQALLKMWQRPDAKQVARDGFALHCLSYQDRLTVPIHLAGREVVQQTAFTNEITKGQKEIVELAISDLLSQIQSKTIGMLDLIGLGLAWKSPGESGQPFELQVARLSDRSKSLAAYLIAHRLIVSNGNLPDIERWLNLALANLSDNEIVATQISDELDELATKQRDLTITNPLE